MTSDSFRCCLVKKTGKDQIAAAVESRPIFDLPRGDVLIHVAYSSVNYKDALALRGHPGVVRNFPHVPGIDAAGTVADCPSGQFAKGSQVLVTSYELGVERWGGWAEYVRVPAEWVIPLPNGLTLEESMALGTAGLTAGLCTHALQHHNVEPASGQIAVTGATGGVGSLAVMLLAKLGYQVVAVSGKTDQHAWLRHLGAQACIGRDEILHETKKPLLEARWAAAIDTVGGSMLASLLRTIKNEGCVACCGLAGGAELVTSVYPFILRGITLAGVDSAWCPMTRRQEIWHLLARKWKPQLLDSVARTIDFNGLQESAERLLSGRGVGRTIVSIRQ